MIFTTLPPVWELNRQNYAAAQPISDYTRRVTCVPRNLPQTNQPARRAARQLAAMLRPIIEANNGRCFLCCAPTRHDARFGGKQFRATMTLPVLLQGKPVQRQLFQQFVNAGNALLVATSSFSGKGWTCAAIRYRW